MILIGQYDSPFVRRVGIALRLYDLPFEHHPLSVFTDGEEVRAHNPLMRVPALVLSDGVVLTDSHLILDYLDGLAAQPLLPRLEPDRHRVLQITGWATGMAEKCVALFYERRLHDVKSALWEARCLHQIGSVVAALEASRAVRPGPYWFSQITHADIAVACALRFATEALPGVIDLAAVPHLQGHCAQMEGLPAFLSICRPFHVSV